MTSTPTYDILVQILRIPSSDRDYWLLWEWLLTSTMDELQFHIRWDFILFDCHLLVLNDLDSRGRPLIPNGRALWPAHVLFTYHPLLLLYKYGEGRMWVRPSMPHMPRSQTYELQTIGSPPLSTNPHDGKVSGLTQFHNVPSNVAGQDDHPGDSQLT